MKVRGYVSCCTYASKFIFFSANVISYIYSRRLSFLVAELIMSYKRAIQMAGFVFVMLLIK